MRLALHIFKKDARRLWWEISVTLFLIAALALADSRRIEAFPGMLEAVVTLLLPFSWVYLIALLVHGESLVGDRQFWVTRPYPRLTLLAAKALFVVAFIHLPFFVADCVIVAARGFNPLECLPSLLWKQAARAAALTLPAAAIAAMTRNLAQFVPPALFFTAVALMLIPGATVFHVIVVLGLAAVSAAILWLQYARRRTALSRSVAGLSLVIGGFVMGAIPARTAFQIDCVLSGLQRQPGPVSLQLDTGKFPLTGWRYPLDKVAFAIPVRMSGLTANVFPRLTPLALEISASSGDRWIADMEFKRGVREAFFETVLGNTWDMLIVDRAFYERVKGKPVDLEGEAGVTLARSREAGRMPAGGAFGPVAGAGRCYAPVMVDDYGREQLRVICESPLPPPFQINVRLADSRTGEAWPVEITPQFGLGVPRLSPLWRAQMLYETISGPRPAPVEGFSGPVPRDAIPHAEITVSVADRTACFVLHYQIRGIQLQDFEIPRQQQ